MVAAAQIAREKPAQFVAAKHVFATKRRGTRRCTLSRRSGRERRMLQAGRELGDGMGRKDLRDG